MKKSIKLVLALAVIAMVAVSCQKEGQFNPSKKVKSITTTSSRVEDGKNRTLTTTKEFSWGSKTLSSVNYYVDGILNKTSSYIYDSKNRLTEMVYKDAVYNVSLVYKYVYDGNYLKQIKEIASNVVVATWDVVHEGKLITEIKYTAGESKSISVVPTANALFFLPDNVIENLNVAMKESNAKGGLGKSSVYFSWENNNLVGYSYAAGSVAYNVKMEYDGKKNPVYGWYDAELNSIDLTMCKHNITKLNVEAKAGSQTETLSIPYQYGYEGSYPTSCKWSQNEVDWLGNTYKVSYEQTFKY